MTDLSPAAQAVKDAAFHSVVHDKAHTLEACIAAALRAAAKELAPKRTLPPGHIFSAPAEQMYHEFRLQVQRELHAIAYELETTDAGPIPDPAPTAEAS